MRRTSLLQSLSNPNWPGGHSGLRWNHCFLRLQPLCHWQMRRPSPSIAKCIYKIKHQKTAQHSWSRPTVMVYFSSISLGCCRTFYSQGSTGQWGEGPYSHPLDESIRTQMSRPSSLASALISEVLPLDNGFSKRPQFWILKYLLGTP